jgi:hypothetical protein
MAANKGTSPLLQRRSSFDPTNTYGGQQVQSLKYCSYSTPLKITKTSYFSSSNAALWYFKEGTKNGFKASLQCIEAGFERVDLTVSNPITNAHRTVTLPNGTVYLLGG